LNEVKDDWYFEFRTEIQENPSAFRSFSVRDGFVFSSAGIINNRQIFVPLFPFNKRVELVKQFHEPPTSGQLGIYKTFQMVRKIGYWPKMQTSIGKILSACLVCQQIKKSNDLPVVEMKSHQVSYAGQTVSIDLVGPLPRSSRGFKYRASAITRYKKCRATGYTTARAGLPTP